MKILLIDYWIGNKDKTEEYQIKGTESATEILNMLDGKKRTQLSITDDEAECTMIIGGGGEKKQFIINFIVGDAEESYIVTDSNLEDSKEEMKIVTGGQEGLFPVKYVNSLEKASKVLKYFIEKTDFSPEVEWEEE